MNATDQLSDPNLWTVVLVISLIGVASKLVYYQLGKRGSKAVTERVPQVTPERLGQLNGWYERHGSRVLVISSVPGVGSALAAAAGIVGVRILIFIIWVFISGLIRNWLVVILFGQALTLLPST